MNSRIFLKIFDVCAASFFCVRPRTPSPTTFFSLTVARSCLAYPPNFSPQATPQHRIPLRSSSSIPQSPLIPFLCAIVAMGLPMWRAPSPEAKDAVKADLTAPARSPIRRRSPFTGRRARPARSPRSPRVWDNIDIDLLGSASRFAPTEPTTRPSSGRPRLPPPPVPESRNYSRHGGTARDASGWLADEDRLTRMRRERYYRSLYDGGRLENMSRTSAGLPAFTPNFAPAAAAHSSRTDATTDRRRSNVWSRPIHYRTYPDDFFGARGDDVNEANNMDGDDSSSDNNAVGFPPLRRMGRRTIADGPLPSSSLRESWSPASTLDGLGDRERSISPVVDDHWETMLTTVAPDPLAPSADSSFTSAAASASFSNSHPSSRAGSSNSNSAASSRTHLTVPSRRQSPPNELFMRACDTSDSDTASDTEAEGEDIVPRAAMAYRRNRPETDAPPSQNPNRYSRGVRNRSREATAYVRGFYERRGVEGNSRLERPLPFHDQLDEPTEESTNAHDGLQTFDEELRHAHVILERLAQREDVSDEFWASVGLTRSVADRIQQRERL